jgi:hypothetical protein
MAAMEKAVRGEGGSMVIVCRIIGAVIYVNNLAGYLQGKVPVFRHRNQVLGACSKTQTFGLTPPIKATDLFNGGLFSVQSTEKLQKK